MASFVEFKLIEYGVQFALNLKDDSDGLEWSISPKWVDEKRWKIRISNVMLTDRNSSLTSSMTRERYGRGGVKNIKLTSWRDGAESLDTKWFKNVVGPK
jgi:hypothetical protein